MNAEMQSKKWLLGGICLQLFTGFTVAFLVYQIGTLVTTGAVGAGFLPGLMAVLAMLIVIVLVSSINNKNAQAEYEIRK